MLNCSWFVWCYIFQNQQKLAWIPKNSAEKYARASFADLVSSIRYTCEAVFRLGFYVVSIEFGADASARIKFLLEVLKKPAHGHSKVAKRNSVTETLKGPAWSFECGSLRNVDCSATIAGKTSPADGPLGRKHTAVG